MIGTITANAKFNRLTFIRETEPNKHTKRALFRCDCGNEKIITLRKVIHGETKSCGCLHKEKVTKHGGVSGYPCEYKIWQQIKDKCCNPQNLKYHYYADKGITVCEEWLISFENFISDVGARPAKNYVLSRIDSNKGFYPENCCWCTFPEHAQNLKVPAKSGIRGIIYVKRTKKWQLYLRNTEGKRVYKGQFETKKLAMEAKKRFETGLNK